MNRTTQLLVRLMAVLWLLGSGSAHAATQCSGVMSGTIPDGVVVSSGFCRLQGATVAGGVRVSGGAFLVVCASTINGGLVSDGAGELIFGAEEIGCDGDVINGAVRINNTGTGLAAPAPSIALERSTLNGGVSLIGNQGLMSVAGNRISGNLFCSGNVFNPDNEGMKNVVSGQISCPFK